jgi:Ca2+-binding EF-hand superfamily protein
MLRASKFFREQDRNQNGKLQYKELYNVVNESLGVDMPLKEIKKLFLEIDDNGNSEITEREFCEWYVDYVEESL